MYFVGKIAMFNFLSLKIYNLSGWIYNGANLSQSALSIPNIDTALSAQALDWIAQHHDTMTHLSKRNLAVRQSTGMEKNPSVCGLWMSTVMTCQIALDNILCSTR